jgi:hypothetical protein
MKLQHSAASKSYSKPWRQLYVVWCAWYHPVSHLQLRWDVCTCWPLLQQDTLDVLQHGALFMLHITKVFALLPKSHCMLG